MADKDQGDGPSLEMPTMGSLFKRRRKSKGTAERPTTPAAADFDALVRGDRASEPDTVAETGPETEPVTGPDQVDEPVSEPVVDNADNEPTVTLPAPDQADSVAHDAADPAPPPAAGPPAGRTPGTDQHDSEPTTILDEPDPEADSDHDDVLDDHETAGSGRHFRLPPLPGRIAAATTGLVIGLMAVGLTYLSLRGCEAVQGTSSCGTPGFFLLVAILIVLVAVGSALLGAWQVTDPTSTSFLAVALLAVIALLFLIQVIFSPWMFVVIPLVAVVTYVLSQWLTSLFEDEFDEDRDEDIAVD